ncbi:hypothetical protein GOP47_0010655 [Adiantum capillus-veneris]|uniref:Pentatricopeptide repeat-containing protein n=1 Tax=Adiantum capillus-veneris TaxID=13818 RepID=A0A9D4ZGL5_ADICA|nr:hypothetical protein GOP47_0010655 [Adiantum capillus-veneris]
MTLGARALLQFMAYKSAHWAQAKLIKERTQLLMASTDAEQVDFCVARRGQAKSYMSQAREQARKDGPDDHQEHKDGAAIVTFLSAFSTRNDVIKDHAISVGRGVANDNDLTGIKHEKLSNGKKIWPLGEWVNYYKSGQATQTKTLVDNNAEKFHEATSLITLIKAATKQRDLQKGSIIHANAVNRGLLKENVFLVIWNALIGGYAQHGDAEKAFFFLDRMQQAG